MQSSKLVAIALDLHYLCKKIIIAHCRCKGKAKTDAAQ